MTRSRIKKALVGLSLLVYLGLLYKYLLTPAITPFTSQRAYNLVPFRTITEELSDSGTPLKNRMTQLFGNLLVMVPIIWYLILFNSRRKLFYTFLLSLTASLGVETYQYFAWTFRVADIDDVLCNTGGAVFVMWIYRLYSNRRPRSSSFS